MRFFFLYIFLFLLFVDVQSANPRGQVMLNRLLHKTAHNSEVLHALNTDSDETDADSITHYPVILEIKEDAEKVLSELEALVWGQRGSLYLTCIPVQNLESIPRDKGIDSYQPASFATPNLDVARKRGNVDLVHKRLNTLENVGSDNHKVVTGICDVGFDPRHEVFRDCLKRWVIYDEYHGKRTAFDGYDNIVANAPASDDISNTHATHVGGILAGYALGSPYYGVAPATDFIATVSNLSDVAICAGIEDVIAFAKETGKPAVVNISCGSYLGPHDGKDLVGRYLSALSEDAVICFSAGNYGQRNNCQNFDLTEDSSLVYGSAWCDMSWNGFHVTGGTDIWGSNDNPFEFRIYVWDKDNKEFVYLSDWYGGDNSEGDQFFDLENTPWLDTGGVWASWGVYPDNNRFNVAFEYDYSGESFQTGTIWARYFVGYHVRSLGNSTHVDVYADGIRSFLHGGGITYCVPGDANGSISNLACCPDVIAVGAWTTRSSVPDVDSGERELNLVVDNVAPWSAYGTTYDGRKLPHFCAPGNTTVSAMSSPHSLTEKDEIDDSRFTAFVHDGYRYFAEAGTSMSSPFAAGIFALWLETCPQLNVHQLRDIAVSTANKNFSDINDPRWGEGAIDAMAGLQKLLSVGNISIDSSLPPYVNISDGTVTVTWPGCDDPRIEIYDITGRRLNNGQLKLGNLYIIEAVNPRTTTRHIFKTVY